MLDHTLSVFRQPKNHSMLLLLLAAWLVAAPAFAAEDATVEGKLIANGKEVALPYVYVWKKKEGFYDPKDPTWAILFVEHPIKPRDLGKHVWDSAWVEIGVTKTAEFSEQQQPELNVYSQSIKMSADSGGNISGGEYPQIELEGLDAGSVSGRIWLAEQQEFFDDKFQYDFTFTAPMSDPNAPIGEALPAGGGEPGQAYLKWVEAVHSGDIEKLKSIVPEEMAAEMASASPEEVREQMGFMQAMTPTGVTITGGSSDGETAILQVEGNLEGEKVSAKVILTKMGNFWLPTETSM